jgi:uncharacterized protein (TIGR02186 family)
MALTRALAALALTALLALPAQAERLVSVVSNPNVQITSSFDGAELSLFGNIEDTDQASDSPYHVIVTVTGPLQDRVAWLKTNNFGFWTNTHHVAFEKFPSFYAVISSGKLDSITTPAVLAEKAVLPESQAYKAADARDFQAAQFSAELVRLMTEDGHFVVRENGVRFLSDTAYVLDLSLPSDVANGPFLVHTMVLKDRIVVAERNESFAVRKTGFEDFVFAASRRQPLLYGLMCVVLALGTGWLAGVAFRR